MKHTRKIAAMLSALLVMTLFAGCGNKTAEFTSPNSEFSMQANASWTTQDVGDDGILALYSKDQTKGILIYQYRKDEYVFTDVADFQESVEDAYPVHDAKSADAPASVPGLSNVTAATGAAVISGTNEDLYAVYGESDTAYYALFYRAKKISDKQIEQFKEYCGTFSENTAE